MSSLCEFFCLILSERIIFKSHELRYLFMAYISRINQSLSRMATISNMEANNLGDSLHHGVEFHILKHDSKAPTIIKHMMRLHSGRRDFKCGHPQYTKSFKSSIELKLHFSNRHEERNVPCDHPGCDKKYGNVKALKIHKRDVHSTKSLVCPTLTCSYCTNSATDLAHHMIVHNGRNEKISCSIEGCQYQGKNTLALKKHMSRHKTLLPCPVVTGCGRYAPTKKVLEYHVKLHNSSDRPFQCPLCCKYYQTLSQLQGYCFAHTNEKPFACGLCDYAASFRTHES